MKNLFNNKHGDLSLQATYLYRFLMVILVFAVIIIVIWIQYSRPYDIRKAEASQIARETVVCLTNNTLTLSDSNFNEKTIRGCFNIDPEDVLIEVNWSNKEVVVGKRDLEFYCGLVLSQQKVEGKYMPACINEEYGVLNADKKTDKISILVGVSKYSSNLF